MSDQAKFEADYLAAFPLHGKAFLEKLPDGRFANVGVDAVNHLWQQQAARQTLEVESLKATHAAEVAELVEILKKRGRHSVVDTPCPARWGGDVPCTCGLEAAIEKYEVTKS